jgi:hypothetical protein
MRRVKIGSGAHYTIEDILSRWESDTEKITLRKSFVEGPEDLLDDIAALVEEGADEAGTMASDGCFDENRAEFAYRSAFVGALVLAERLRGNKVGRLTKREFWRRAGGGR